MNGTNSQALPRLFWIVASFAIIWNLVGVTTYVMDVTTSEDSLATLPVEQQALYAARPAWVAGAFAIAVFAGLIGSIALAMRKSLATPIFILSLVAVVVQLFYTFVLSNWFGVMGYAGAVLPSGIFVIATALVWFSKRAEARGWIG